MKRFQFSLQALLTVRRRQEQIALEQFAQAAAARQLAIDRLNEVKQECETAWALRRERTRTGAPAMQLAQLHDYGRVLEQLQKNCDRALREAQRVVDQKWEKLLAARQAREAVDKFLERQRQRYDRELQREEQKMLDDMVNQRALTATQWKAPLQNALN
jgi:flagellar FliJ protein